MRALGNILQLGLKELRSLYRDPALMVLIVYSFTLAIYSSAVNTQNDLGEVLQSTFPWCS